MHEAHRQRGVEQQVARLPHPPRHQPSAHQRQRRQHEESEQRQAAEHHRPVRPVHREEERPLPALAQLERHLEGPQQGVGEEERHHGLRQELVRAHRPVEPEHPLDQRQPRAQHHHHHQQRQPDEREQIPHRAGEVGPALAQAVPAVDAPGDRHHRDRQGGQQHEARTLPLPVGHQLPPVEWVGRLRPHHSRSRVELPASQPLRFLGHSIPLGSIDPG